MNPTIQVTINPEAKTAKEIDYSVEACNCVTCREIRERLRTFEITSVIITAWGGKKGEFSLARCSQSIKPGVQHTAEILETYPEIREGKSGRCRIIS